MGERKNQGRSQKIALRGAKMNHKFEGGEVQIYHYTNL